MERQFLFEVGGHLFAASVSGVREVLEPLDATVIPGAVTGVLGLINVRGDLVVAADMAALIDLPHGDDSEAALIVFEREGRRVALRVDRVIGLMAPSGVEPDVDPELLRALGAPELVGSVGRVDGRPYIELDMAAVFDRVLAEERAANIDR